MFCIKSCELSLSLCLCHKGKGFMLPACGYLSAAALCSFFGFATLFQKREEIIKQYCLRLVHRLLLTFPIHGG